MFAAGGTYWFVIDESKPVIDRVKAGCAHDASSDAAAADCVEGIRQEGAREGFRISGNNPAQLTWTSFGMKDGHEEVFLEIPVAVTATEGTVVHVRATGPARGSQLPAGHHGPDTLAFDVVDAHTMAMIDPEKGRLVYRERL